MHKINFFSQTQPFFSKVFFKDVKNVAKDSLNCEGIFVEIRFYKVPKKN